MLENMGQLREEILLEIHQKAWKEEQTPEDWQMALFTPVQKRKL